MRLKTKADPVSQWDFYSQRNIGVERHIFIFDIGFLKVSTNYIPKSYYFLFSKCSCIPRYIRVVCFNKLNINRLILDSSTVQQERGVVSYNFETRKLNSIVWIFRDLFWCWASQRNYEMWQKNIASNILVFLISVLVLPNVYGKSFCHMYYILQTSLRQSPRSFFILSKWLHRFN